MNLFILRHGIAEDMAASDKDRALTSEGEQKLRKIAKAMGAMELSLDLVLSSPYKRARQTAEIVAGRLGHPRGIELSETLAPGGSTKKLVALLQRVKPPAENVLLVGHEPYLSELIALLLFGETLGSVGMKKGGLCKLVAPSLRHGRCATLEWLLTPKQMQLMA